MTDRFACFITVNEFNLIIILIIESQIQYVRCVLFEYIRLPNLSSSQVRTIVFDCWTFIMNVATDQSQVSTDIYKSQSEKKENGNTVTLLGKSSS